VAQIGAPTLVLEIHNYFGRAREQIMSPLVASIVTHKTTCGLGDLYLILSAMKFRFICVKKKKIMILKRKTFHCNCTGPSFIVRYFL